MILIALVLLIAVGPEQLPGVIRRTGRVVGQLKTMSDGLRRDFNASLDEIERAADVKSWVGPELEATVESVKEATVEPFKADFNVDGSTKVADIWSNPPKTDANTAATTEVNTADTTEGRIDGDDPESTADDVGGGDIDSVGSHAVEQADDDVDVDDGLDAVAETTIDVTPDDASDDGDAGSGAADEVA